MNTVNKPDWLCDFASSVTSHCGEDGILEKIFEILPSQQERWCVEFGAHDGKSASNTWDLLANKGWYGVLIEANTKRFKQACTTHKNNPRVFPIKKYVSFEGASSLDNILTTTPIPQDFDLLSIDVDGCDYYVWESIRAYKPKVVVIEINPSIPIDVEFVQKKDFRVNQGNSILSLTKLAKDKGYELIAATHENAIYVLKELFNLFAIGDNSIAAIYTCRMEEVKLFHLFDGTVVLSRPTQLIWHGLKIKPTQLQVLPKLLRVFPNGSGIVSFFWKALLLIRNRLRRAQQ